MEIFLIKLIKFFDKIKYKLKWNKKIIELIY